MHDSYVTYGNLHALSGNLLHTAHNVFLHFHELGKLPRKLWSELSGGLTSESMS